MEAAHQHRTIPFGEMLRAGIGVLQRGEELRGPVGGLAIALPAANIARQPRGPASFDQTLQAAGGIDLRSFRLVLVHAVLEPAQPLWMSRVEVLVLPVAQPVV